MEGAAFARVLIRAFVWGGLVTAVLGLAGAALIGADAVRRIDGVTRAIQRIVGGDLSERLPVRGRRDDLDRLVHVINACSAELERLMQEVKGVCDNIAHDLRTPLTRLLAGLERTRRRAGPIEDYAAAVDEAIPETSGSPDHFRRACCASRKSKTAPAGRAFRSGPFRVIADAVDSTSRSRRRKA